MRSLPEAGGGEGRLVFTDHGAGLVPAIPWMFSSAPPSTVLVQAFPRSLQAGHRGLGLGWTSDARVAVLPSFREGCFFQIKGNIVSQ